MRITFHIGVPFAGASHLTDSVWNNRFLFAEHGVRALSARAYRPAIAEMLDKLDGLPPIEHEQNALLHQILADSTPDTMVLVDAAYSGPISAAISEDMLFPELPDHAMRLSELFDGHDLTLSIALRHPAALISELSQVGQADRAVQAFLANGDPTALSWVDTVDEVRERLPEVGLLMWCEEDVPLIWPRVLRKLTGLAPNTPVRLATQRARALLTDEGAARLQTYMERFPPKSETDFEAAVLAFLDKYADPEALPVDCRIKTWTEDLIDRMTENYEADVAALSARDDIDFILPLAEGA